MLGLPMLIHPSGPADTAVRHGEGMVAMKRWSGQFFLHHRLALMFAASLGLLAIVALAITGRPNTLFIAIVAIAAISALFVRVLFPNDALLSLTLVNLIAVYAAVFAFFVDELFGRVGPHVSAIGFCAPIVGFLLGLWRSRAEVGMAVEKRRIVDGRSLLQAIVWLAPVFFVGAVLLLLSAVAEDMINSQAGFIAAMSVIAVIVQAAARTIATFLMDAGLLFEEFFQRMSRLAIPAFAFLTFYALLVIVFASLYVLMSQHAALPHFRIAGEARTISFSEAIHFSIVTLSTVGYGDIVPSSNLARALASGEVICGVLLLLFGVSELQEYAREHRRDRPGASKVPSDHE